ncbi:MAG: DNA polymerase III subunit tau [Cellvibrionales bacterium UBA7375]|nr:MAG: DNA polymerase III subunit tau [Cellvibrionales bacterium UBA7375]
MSYQVLARKWRPNTFSEMVGQEHVLQALINALDNDRLHHAYLFTGTRGVGKTTIARILAKCLNCEEGVSSKPCGVCSSCQEIASGRFIDLMEVDAASRTGVDDMRDLLDNVQYAPARGRYKVYLIDEVHMLSKQSFAALLKTLEEPPEHVKFLFATTDPQKLPITVLSRCLQFNLKNLSTDKISQHLNYVLNEEKLPSEELGTLALARAADGSMRDALSLTDQAIGHGGGKITESDVNAMLGTIDRSFAIGICNALIAGDGTQLLAEVSKMAELSPDYIMVLADLLSIWHQVAIMQTVPESIDKTLSHYADICEIANSVSREDIQLYYQICLLGRKDLDLAPDLKSGFEMVLLRALAFRPGSASGSKKSAPIKANTGAESSLKKPKAEVSPVPQAQQKITPKVELVENHKPAVIQQVEPEITPVKEQAAVEQNIADLPIETNNNITLNQLAPNNWLEVHSQLNLGASLGEIASHCLLSERRENQLFFIIDQEQTSLYDAAHQQSLEEALSDYFGVQVSVEISFGKTQKETPRAANIRAKEERLAAAIEVLNQDPDLQEFKQKFDANLDAKTVRPID